MLVRRLATLLGSGLVVVLSLSNAGAQANPRSCITSLNHAGAKVAASAQKDAVNCAKLVTRYDLPPGVSGQQCLSADLHGRVAKASAHASTVDTSRCTPPPSFGYAGGAAVAAAGRQLSLDLVADLFGSNFGNALVTVKCQRRLLDDATKLTAAQLDEFLSCKKAGLANGAISDGASLAGCLAAIDADPHGKIDIARQRLIADDGRYCAGFDHHQLFPSYCLFATDFRACVEVRARCRVCEALNRTDALAMDCEAFDDGLANGSCGPCEPDPDGLCCNASDRDACGFCGGTGFRCGWAEISVAATHACGRKLDGSLACWGHNFAGELGAPGGSFIQVVSGGSSGEVTNKGHSCALHPDQTAECWGRNDFGQASPPPDTFVQLAAGSHHTCGLHPDGTIACWGLNDFGQASPPSGTFTRISAVRRANCALRTDGEVECWGDNFYGSLTPPPGPFLDVEAGAVESYAILPDQTIAHWGEPGAQFIPPAGAFVEVDGGVVNGCARRPDGSIACWPDEPSIIAPIPPPGTFTQMDSGERIWCAIRSDTTLICWGDLYTQSGPPPK
jgi:hypothetical protein